MTQPQTEHGVVKEPAARGAWIARPSSVAFEVKHMMIATVRGEISAIRES